ncbi:hypothetical protein PVAP13_7NG020468 [Panicum virgatum]|uniref:Uncharacterized protein n=1 Tax=Panicum virgatum TaxID=38727 RepID=A0A8T0PYC9_PANVG|nr:hypothetical protein PVAP13_7NG020468 [Panicum virgatum]
MLRTIGDDLRTHHRRLVPQTGGDRTHLNTRRQGFNAHALHPAPIPRPAALDWRPSSPKFRSTAAAPRRPCRAARCSQLRITPATPPFSASGRAAFRRAAPRPRPRRASAPPRPASRAGRRAALRGRPGRLGVGQAGSRPWPPWASGEGGSRAPRPACGARRRRKLPPWAHGLAGSRAPRRACGALRRRRGPPAWVGAVRLALRGQPDLPPRDDAVPHRAADHLRPTTPPPIPQPPPSAPWRRRRHLLILAHRWPAETELRDTRPLEELLRSTTPSLRRRRRLSCVHIGGRRSPISGCQSSICVEARPLDRPPPPPPVSQISDLCCR